MKALKIRPLLRFWKLPQSHQCDSAQRFRTYTERAIWKRYADSFRRTASLLFRTSTWPITAAIIGATCVASYGRLAKSRAGTGLHAQFVQQWLLAVKHLVHPLHYYQFGLYRAERRERALEYVANTVARLLIPIMNQHAEWQKPWFADACLRHGLPHVPTLAIFDGGRSTPFTAGETLPRADLFVKPSHSWGGRGATRWRYTSAFEDGEDNRLTPDELVQHLAAVSRNTPLVIQPAIANHADIAPISNGALCTVRILTGLKKGAREPVYILTSLRMAIGRSITDNFSAGGIAAPVNADTGRLGAAVSADPSKPFYFNHPDSGEAIAGRVLPMWRECVDLCVRAHRYFGPVALVGWDIALTPEGPLLVEGNLTCGVEMLQMSHGTPILGTPFVEVALSHLDCGAEQPCVHGDKPNDQAASFGTRGGTVGP